MKRAPIESSRIISMGYDSEALILEIEFKRNRIYQYQPVSKYMWGKLLAAESKGKYFQDHIRSNPRINYEEVDELQAS